MPKRKRQRKNRTHTTEGFAILLAAKGNAINARPPPATNKQMY